MKNKKDTAVPLKVILLIVLDIVASSVSFLGSYIFITGNTEYTILSARELFYSWVVYEFLLITVSALLGLYRSKNLRGMASTLSLTFLAIAVSHIFSIVVFSVLKITIVGIVAFSGVFSTIFMVLIRLVNKYYFEQKYKSKIEKMENLIPTLIIGAGFSGKMVYHELKEKSGDEYLPVCFVDDDKEKIGTDICSIPVYGPSVFIPELCKKYNIGMVIFAIPSCSIEKRSRILENCKGLNCDVRIVPTISELKNENGEYFKQSVYIDVEKLLGRDAIRLKNDKVFDYIKDKVCLVTGGGGSIGSELCRQIVKMSPKHLVILDIYENNAYDIQQELKRNGVSKEIFSVEIASVRDKHKMDALFKKYKFDIVFHASAHKHVPLMEDNPEEAVKNNVFGTYNIAHMCHKYKTEKMVLISTDKAVNPTNVMGATKRLCEMIMQYMAQRYSETKYTAVRFGNVLGSNGSVIPLFANQIAKGGPVTVTHPDIIRYFMTIPEAVSLVMEAGTMSSGGEIFVLNMGEPVKIVTLAENLIKMYGYKPYEDIPIEFCGLRPGEKLFEELLMNDENLKKTYNKKIFINDQLEVDCDNLKNQLEMLFKVANSNNSEETVKLLHKFVTTFKTPEEINSKNCCN